MGVIGTRKDYLFFKDECFFGVSYNTNLYFSIYRHMQSTIFHSQIASLRVDCSSFACVAVAVKKRLEGSSMGYLTYRFKSIRFHMPVPRIYSHSAVAFFLYLLYFAFFLWHSFCMICNFIIFFFCPPHRC